MDPPGTGVRPQFLDTTAETHKVSSEGLDRHCTWRSHNGSGSQIDFILGELSECIAWGSGDPPFRSDHCVLWCEFAKRKKVMVTRAGAHKGAKTLKGWTPTGIAQLHNFRDETSRQLQEILQDTDSLHSRGSVIEEAERVICESAAKHGAAAFAGDVGGLGRGRPKCPRQLRELERAASRPTCNSDDRRRMRTSVRKLRRSWRLDLAKWRLRVARKTSAAPPFSMMDESGEMTSDTKRWSRALHAHCEAKYTRPGEDGRQRALMGHLNERVSEEQDSVAGQASQPVWSWAIKVQARAPLQE